MCPSGKRPYDTKRQAKRVKRSGSFNRTRLLPYRCDACGSWHLGHRTPGYYQRQAA